MMGKGDLTVSDVEMSRKPTLFQRWKAHMRKWWWVHLILFLAGFLIITLILVYVAFPKIAQSNVDASKLEINKQRLSGATPEEIRFTIESTSKSDSMYHPRLGSFNASMSIPNGKGGEGTPFGYLTIPETQAGKAVPVAIDQVVPIVNMDEWIQFNKMVLNQEEFGIHIQGRMKVHEGALPVTTSTFSKTVTMKGLNKLNGFKLTNTKILGLTKKSKITGDVFLPNPSVLTLEMGTVTMNIMVDGEQIGSSTLDNLVLTPGGINVKMNGETDRDKALKFLGKYKNGVLPLSIVGNKSVVNGVEIPYFTETLASNTLHTDFDLTAALGSLGGGSGGL